MNRSLASPRSTPIDESIFEFLVIPLPMVVIDKLCEGAPEMLLPRRHYPIEARPPHPSVREETQSLDLRSRNKAD